MYDRPARRRAATGIAGAPARQYLTDCHHGPAEEFLRRHECEVTQALSGSRSEFQTLVGRLLMRAGDTRNVRLAIDHCASRGQAAGPNGLTPSELSDHTRWALARALGEMIREGSFQPGNPRTVWIDKGGNRGQRPIRIQNFEDRCVERSILQIIRPFTQAQFLNHSMGFRNPGCSRERALATVEHWAEGHDQWSWISEDLRDAFEHIPTGRLSQILQRMIPNADLCNLIGRIAFTRSGRGIRQGGPLSPELLNVFLHWMLDRPWTHQLPDYPLFRVADDLLILGTPDEMPRLYHALVQRTMSIGMPLKGTILSAVRDLNSQQSINWLGYQIRRNETGLDVNLGQRSWEKLEEHLRLAWEDPIPSLAANESIRGWISQQGACYQESQIPLIYRELSRLASEEGFREIPERSEIAMLWSRAFDRDWLQARQDVHQLSLSETTPAGGSANQHSESAGILARGRVENSTGSQVLPSLRRREVSLFCDGSCLSPHGVGAWAYLMIDQETGFQESDGGTELQATNNRMELQAVIHGLMSLHDPSHVHVIVDSQYVANGITDWLSRWIQSGWRGGRRGRRIANVDLWQRLAEQLLRHQVDCRWVRGHAGHPENEFVDQLARNLAEQSLREQHEAGRYPELDPRR